MEKLPSEFGGWLNCGRENVLLNIVYFAKAPLASRAELLALVHRYVDVVSPSEIKRIVVKESGSLEQGLWMEIESHRQNGTSTHFLFTSPKVEGETQLFIYTDTTAHARNQSGVIRSIRTQVTTPEFLKRLRSNSSK